MGQRSGEVDRTTSRAGVLAGAPVKGWRSATAETGRVDPAVDPPTVFVVDDDLAMRESLTWLMRSVGLGVETFASAEEFLAAYDQVRPGCLVLDVRLTGMDGLQLQDELLRRGIGLPIIFVTGYGEVPVAVCALKHGAVDFVEKPFSDHHMLDRVHEAIRADREIRDLRAAQSGVVSRIEALTPRQREVMQLVANGLPNRAIARELGASVKTVEAHRAHMMKKLGLDSVAGLVRMVSEWKPGAVAKR